MYQWQVNRQGSLTISGNGTLYQVHDQIAAYLEGVLKRAQDVNDVLQSLVEAGPDVWYDYTERRTDGVRAFSPWIF
ncbi:MAG: hypothetical protein HYV63_19585 [Candidatus Schekmanbacteria bacterium]|nr:hypothetical protein [Candidatus Schekmanbacteria bacterium]